MTTTSELKRLAEAAACGPWDSNGTCVIFQGGKDGRLDLRDCPVPYETAAFIGLAHPETILAILARLEKAEAALKQIASYDDEGANHRLAATGSYALFDEPGSVEIARAALESP
jgi:hypothetical protein